MANRGTAAFGEFKSATEALASATLAHHLASAEQKAALIYLFGLLAEYIEFEEPAPEKQAVYGKTLLGVSSAKELEAWVIANRPALLKIESSQEWLEAVWPLFAAHCEDRFFHAIEPAELPIELASLWLKGSSYAELFAYGQNRKGTKPFGEKRRRLTGDDIIDFCENTLGFDCSLLCSAVPKFLFQDVPIDEESRRAFNLFQKSLDYGLPDLDLPRFGGQD